VHVPKASRGTARSAYTLKAPPLPVLKESPLITKRENASGPRIRLAAKSDVAFTTRMIKNNAFV